MPSCQSTGIVAARLESLRSHDEGTRWGDGRLPPVGGPAANEQIRCRAFTKSDRVSARVGRREQETIPVLL
jgi:hypothetical protein